MEGVKAYQNAITFLEKQRPLPPLKWNSLLYKASRDHVTDIGPKGMTTSKGSDASTPFERIQRYGKLEKSWADSCIFGA